MAWRFDAATDKVLVASGWTGSVATICMWVQRVVDRNAGSNPWRAWSNAAGGGSTVAGLGSDGGGDTIVSFDSAFSNLTGPSLVGNGWHCVALVMNGTSWTMYYGTDPASLTTVSGTKANATTPGSWTLVDSPDFFSGDIANVKLFQRALTSGEAAAELASDAQVSGTNLLWRGTLRTSSNTPETGTVMTAGGTAIAVVAGPPALDHATGTSATTISATATAVGLPPPLASYSFEGSGTVTDDSGNGHNWTLGGSAIRSASGHTLGGLATNGGGTLATLANPAFGQTASRTVMCWMINPANVTQWVVRWNVVSLGSGSWGFLLFGSTIVAQARNASTFVRAAANRPVDGLWHHYAATYDGTNVRMYLDGTLTDTQALTSPMRTDADTVDIGEWTDTSTVIDDLRMYDSALSAAQITALAAMPVTLAAATGGGTSATTVSATAAARLAGAASSSTTVSATATAQALGTATSTTTIAATAAVRLVGTAGSITTVDATAAGRALAEASSSTTISATAAGSAAGAVGGGTSATTISATAAGRLIGGGTSVTTISATAVASGTVGAASVTVLSATAAAIDATPPQIAGVPHGGTLTMTPTRHVSVMTLTPGWSAVSG